MGRLAAPARQSPHQHDGANHHRLDLHNAGPGLPGPFYALSWDGIISNISGVAGGIWSWRTPTPDNHAETYYDP
jgi:hypothetical protein